MQKTPNGIADGQREQQRADELHEQQKRTNERIRGQIEQAQKSLDRQAELVEQARQQRQQQDDRDRERQAAQRGSTHNDGQSGQRLVIRNVDDDENKPQKKQQQQVQSEKRETPAQDDAQRDSRAELQGQPEPRAMALDDAARYALRRDEEHLDRQDQLGSMIDESSDPVERERLTLVKDAEHHAYSADQIDRILDMQTRLDRVAGTNVSSSPEFERLRERGTEHRAALGDTMQALEHHNAQHPPTDRPQASTRSDTTAAPSEARSTPSPRPNFAERASARRTAAEAQGATMPPREHNTPAPSPSASHAPAHARTTDETRGRSR